jgi:hypothetical protein
MEERTCKKFSPEKSCLIKCPFNWKTGARWHYCETCLGNPDIKEDKITENPKNETPDNQGFDKLFTP